MPLTNNVIWLGCDKCSTKPLSKLLFFILSAVKTELQSYCDPIYFVSGVNYVWILKNSKDILDSAYPFGIFKLFIEYIHTQSRSCHPPPAIPLKQLSSLSLILLVSTQI